MSRLFPSILITSGLVAVAVSVALVGGGAPPDRASVPGSPDVEPAVEVAEDLRAIAQAETGSTQER